ncbi:MAG TPA: hypothetical protein VMU80_08470 [Bryobacteraceae bacterium]|nr:hypothetical protein [Bryobacteraceae bacterium]
MKTKLLALVLFAGGSLLAAPRVVIGVGVGGYVAPAPVVAYAPPPAPVAAYVSPAPGPGFTWVGGYWYPYGGRYAWRAGYWARRPYPRAHWVAPRYYGHRYYGGYWRR